MHKLVFHALTLAVLSLTACTQSAPTKSADVSYGGSWLRPGKHARYQLSGTLYLKEGKPQELPPNAISLPSLRRLFGMEKFQRVIGQEKVNYITD